MTIIRRPLRLKPRYALAGIIVALSLCLASTFRLLRTSYAHGFRNAKARPLRIYDRYFGYHSAMTDIVIPGALGPVQLRVYTPIGDTHPLPIVMVHGFAPNGNKDGYLNLVANRLSQMGYVVVLPYVPAEAHYEMRATDLTVIGDAIRWSAHSTGEKVSVFGISFGAGLIIPAAVQPSVTGDVGRYYLHDRVYDPNGKPYVGNPPGPLLIVSQYLGELVSPKDIPAMRRELDILNSNFDRTVGDNSTKETRTNPRDRKKLNELQTADTPQMHQLYLDILTRHHAEMEAISPISVLHNINVPLYILHGQDDPVFPEGEVEWMRKELAGNRNAHILVSPWIAHAFVGQPATQGERLRVINFGAQLLYEASRPSPIAH